MAPMLRVLFASPKSDGLLDVQRLLQSTELQPALAFSGALAGKPNFFACELLIDVKNLVLQPNP